MSHEYAFHLLWVDIETDCLPDQHDGIIDFRPVHLMEIGCIVTDLDLNIHNVGGYTEVVKMTQETADTLRGNEVVRNMHRDSGLIKDSLTATKTLDDIDTEIDEYLAEVGLPKGNFAMAGSGIASFDLLFVRAKMPKTASWLAYYPYDFGVFRRLSKALAGREVINPDNSSAGTEKVHRAMSDVEAHLREAQRFRDWVRNLPPMSF